MSLPRLALLIALVTVPAAGLQAGKAPVDLNGVVFGCLGTEKVTLKGQGSLTDYVVSAIAFSPTNWLSQDEEGLQLAGTYQVVGSKVYLSYDSQSIIDLSASLEKWMEEEAPFDVTVTGLAISTVGTAKVGKDGVKTVKYKTTATFTASGGGYTVAGKLSEKGAGTESP